MNFLALHMAFLSVTGSFFYGLLAAFSPCVFPFYPICFTYLSSNTHKVDENGRTYYDRKKVINNVVFFVIGIILAYSVIIALAFSLTNFLSKYKIVLELLLGIFLIILGLFQFDIIKIKKLEEIYRKEINVDKMNSFKALLFGFSLALSWSPCIGPYLVSAISLIVTEFSYFTGLILMVIYTLGFSLPFLLFGILSTEAINFLNKFKNIVKYTTKIGATIIVIMGVYMLFNTYKDINEKIKNLENNFSIDKRDYSIQNIMNIPLHDQFGNLHTLSDYSGKIVVLNFWATWCGYCVDEIPEIIKVFEERGYNKEDIIVLGVGSPSTEELRSIDINEKEFSDFIIKHKINYPVLFDVESYLFDIFNVTAFPTTIFINKEGKISGNIIGGTNKEKIDNIINSLK